MHNRMLHAAFAALFITILLPAAASACTCGSMPSSCNTTWKSGQIVFLGTVVSQVPITTPRKVGNHEYETRGFAFHFSVKESFRGSASGGQEIVIYTGAGGGDCFYPFRIGVSYLVYASAEDDRLTTGICSQTAPEVLAGAVVRELRTLRDGDPTSILFGTIGIGPRGAGYEDLVESKSLADVRVRIVGKGIDYTTKTDQQGLYAFRSVIPDSYQLEIDLPAGLSTWQRKSGKSTTVDLSGGAAGLGCRADLFARPDGRISGSVVDSSGRRIAGFLTIRYADPKEAETLGRRGGLPGSSTEDGNFSLWLLPPGRYQLIFYPKIAGGVDFRRSYSSDAIDVGFGQHIENFRFEVPIANPFDSPKSQIP